MTLWQLEAKKEQGQSLEQAQNPLKNLMQDMEWDIELNQNSFLGNNVDRGKFFKKESWKNTRIVVRVTARRRLSHEISWQTLQPFEEYHFR